MATASDSGTAPECAVIPDTSGPNRHTDRPSRWIVERTFAWLNRCRRLAKDWENLNRKALAFLRMTSIRLMVRRLYKAK
jgi:transposase